MPNWELESDYSFCAHLDDSGWAWEFLRRNPGYLEAWKKFETWKAPWEQKLGPFDRWYTPEGQPPDSAEVWVYENTTSADGSPESVAELVPSARGRVWWLTRMYDPANSPAAEVKFRPRTIPPIWRKQSDVRMGGAESQEIFEAGAYTWIDLGEPLAPQFRSLETRLKRLQTRLQQNGVVGQRIESPKPKKDKWHDYLRVLDAVACGVTQPAIAAKLHPALFKEDPEHATKFVHDRLDAARHLSSLGYRRILP